MTEFSEVESLRPTSRNAEVVHPNGLIKLVGNVCPPPLNARAIPCGWKRAMMAPMIPTASTLSDVPEHRREDDHDNRRPHGIDRQVIRLPPFEERERPTPAEEAHVEHGGPGKVDEQDHVLAQRGHAVGAEAELGDPRGYGPQRYRVSQ